MTPQEISEFVNQPIPRKVPREISRKVTFWHHHYIWIFLALTLLWPVSLLNVTSQVPIMDFIRLLNSGPHNRMTTQGSIISIIPTRLWRIGPTSYYLTTRFSTPDGDRITASYVWRRGNIPGWGVIPETQNNPRITEALSLAEPFPVTVEYFRTHSHIARAVGTRFSIGISDGMFHVALFGLIILASIAGVFIHARIAMRILKRGLFTTGHISLHKDLSKNISIFSMLKHMSHSTFTFFTVSFTDQRGIKRESSIRFSPGEKDDERIMDFFRNEQPVGLLYLPDTNEVLITDLWLDSHPISETSRNNDRQKIENDWR